MADRSMGHLTLGIGLLDGGFRIEVVEVVEEEARTEKEGLLTEGRQLLAGGQYNAQAAAGRANGGATRGWRGHTAQCEAMSEYRRRFARYRGQPPYYGRWLNGR